MTILFIIINYFTQNIPFLIGSNPLANSSQPAGIDQGPIISALAKKLFVCHHQCFKNADGLSRFYNFCPMPDGTIFKGHKITLKNENVTFSY